MYKFKLLLLIMAVLSVSACEKKNVIEDEKNDELKLVETSAILSSDETNSNLSFVKEFYTRYLDASDKLNYQDIIDLKNEYLSPMMVREMNIRERISDADPFLLTQDSTGMIDKFNAFEDDDKSIVIVVFDNSDEQYGEKRTFKIHVNEKDGKKYIDAIDSNIERKNADGTIENYEYNTTYANHELTDSELKSLEETEESLKNAWEMGYIS